MILNKLYFGKQSLSLSSQTIIILALQSMNILLPKIGLLKDIRLEYGKSMKSVELVHRECQHLLHRVDDELCLRLQEKRILLTQVGVNLRDFLLESYRGLKMKVIDVLLQIHSECVRYEEIYMEMIEQHQVLQQTIKNSELSVDELQRIKQKEEYLAHLLGSRLAAEQIKENLPFQGMIAEKKLLRVSSWKGGEKKQIGEENNRHWLRMMSQCKERKEDLINQQRKYEQAQIAELNTLIESCLRNIADFSFMKVRKRLNLQGIKVVQSFSKQSPPQVTNNLSHGISLGLESINSEQLNLLCNQEFNFFNRSQHSALQRITEREEEYSNSSSTPLKKLQDPTQ